MLRSMTGFGRSLTENGEWSQTWEIRSVNSRFLDIKWKLPPQARRLEARLEKVVRRFGERGRVEISLMLRRHAEDILPEFNTAQAHAMLDALQTLADERGETFVPDHNALLSLPSLWVRPNDGSEDEDDDAGQNEVDFTALCEEGLAAALEDWNESRAAEGEALSRDIASRVLRMEEWVTLVADRAPEIREERFALLRERLSEALSDALRGLLRGEAGGEMDETRFLQEMVILADKLDVSEELTRLSAHLDRLRELLAAGQDAGKRLDFTLQECFREINTCGNKIQDSQTSRLVVDFKNELEKCREQVQNLE